MFTLMVPASGFIETVKRHSTAGSYPAVYTPFDFQSPVVTAAFPERNFMIVGLFEEADPDITQFREKLEVAGLHVYDGIWDLSRATPPVPPMPEDEYFDDEDEDDDNGLFMEGEKEEFFVASVGFVTRDAAEPYLWTDIYPFRPTEEEVLEDMLAWLEDNNVLKAEGVAEFRAQYPTNVRILSSAEMEGW